MTCQSEEWRHYAAKLAQDRAQRAVGTRSRGHVKMKKGGRRRRLLFSLSLPTNATDQLGEIVGGELILRLTVTKCLLVCPR